jgi:O-succinylbenzoate synthase
MSNKNSTQKIIQATLFSYQLPFKKAMRFKQYQLNMREGLILQLTDNQGINHFSDISPLPGYSHETLATVKKQIITLLSTSLKQLFEYQQHSHSVQFALDSLVYSLANKTTKQYVAIDKIPLFQGDKEQVMGQYQALNKPNLIKLKVAREALEVDIKTFQSLCQLNPHLKIRCDANQAWNLQQAEQFFSEIDVQQLDYIEEPTCDHNTNLQLADKYQVAIALDETLQQANFSYQHHPSINAFIIKPTLIGNKDKIDRLVSTATQQGITVSISSSFESVVGLQQLKNLANYYLAKSSSVQQGEPELALSLGIDTLKYFNSTLLMEESSIGQDCQQLEVVWSNG